MTTQFATASYQEIIDLHTETDKVSVLGIHTPVGEAPYAFLQGFFDAFQKYHYDGCSMSLVPAARLPADPSQVSYEAGVQPIDPRDLLNPIMFHGAHGESLGSVLNQFYAGGSGSSDVTRKFSESVDLNEVSQSQVGNDVIWQSLYYRALSDNTWRKAHPQSGLRVKGMHPLVYGVGSNAQYSNMPAGFTPNVMAHENSPRNPDENVFNNGSKSVGTLGSAGSSALNAMGQQGLQYTSQSGADVYANIPGGWSGSQFFTERLHGLGWLDTRVRTIPSSKNVQVDMTGDKDLDELNMEALYEQVEEIEKINYLPRLFMGICLLPPAYKAEQYYRLVINHRFSFRKFRGLSTRGDIAGQFGPGTSPGYAYFY